MQIRLSASSIRTWLTCQTKYRLSYVAGLDPDRDEEALRIGGAWAKMHEAYEKRYQAGTSDEFKQDVIDSLAIAAASASLNAMYNIIPPGTPANVWEA